jgi:tetratricopeptide (TPR) repeat protein
VRAELGDDRGAARDLGQALEIEPQHPEALFRRAQSLRRMDVPDQAARCLERFLEVAPGDPRRPQVELALSEILAENMDDLAGAIVQLEHVARQAPDDALLRERLIDLMVRAGEHRRATEELRQLERLRASPVDQARDLLRLARLLRDALGDAAGAMAALERVRQIEPLSIEPVRQLVELSAEGSQRRAGVLAQARAELCHAIAEDPGRASLYERLAAVAQWAEDDQARGFALAAEGALGSLPGEQRAFLTEWRARSRAQALEARLGDPLHPTDWARLLDPQAGGFAGELWSLIAPAVCQTLPAEPPSVGFARGDRIKGKDLERRFPAVLAVLRAFGCEEPEVYVSDQRPKSARVIGGEKRALYLGADVAEAREPESRFLLGRAGALLREGRGPLADLEDSELGGWFAAAAELAETAVPAPVQRWLDGGRRSEQADRVKHLGRQVGRRERKALAAQARQFAELGDPGAWRRVALASAARAGLLLAGDLDAALGVLDIGRGARSLSDDPIGLSLLVWSVSDDHLHLRRRLGVGT